MFCSKMNRDEEEQMSEDDESVEDLSSGEQFAGRKPGFGVRPLGFVDLSDDEGSTSACPSREKYEKYEGDKGSSSMNLLPVFPDNLNWNEARERWVVWKPLFVRLLELRRGIKSERDKETMLIARGGALIQDIAFAQRPAPGEVTQVEQGGEAPVFENLLKRCDYYFTANSHAAIDIERFRNVKQKVSEPFTLFVNRLRRLANLCGFGPDADREIKMQMLSGAIDRKLLIQQGVMHDKSLAELETYGMRLEMSRDLFAGSEENVKAKEEPKTEEVGILRENRRAWKQSPYVAGGGFKPRQEFNNRNSGQSVSYRGYQGRRPMSGMRSDRGGRSFSGGGERKCQYCATTHKFGTCPAFGKECLKCGRMNHFAAACKQEERVSAVSDRYQSKKESQVTVDDEWE